MLFHDGIEALQGIPAGARYLLGPEFAQCRLAWFRPERAVEHALA